MNHYKIQIGNMVFTRRADHPFDALLMLCQKPTAEVYKWLCDLPDASAMVFRFWPENSVSRRLELLTWGTADEIVRKHCLFGCFAKFHSDMDMYMANAKKDLSFWKTH